METGGKKRLIIGLVVLALAIIAASAWWWNHRFHNYTPMEAILDLQAAARVRDRERPVEQFLELRYGPLSEPQNRQRAFMDFFNVGHIEGLQILVNRMQPERRTRAVNAMAQWIADYRKNMTPEEKEALRAALQSEAGRVSVQQATSKYLAHDVRYRAATAPVIIELMTTLAEVQKP